MKMPKVSKTEVPMKLHTKTKFGADPQSNSVEQLSAIKVNIVHAPSTEEFRAIISQFMMNTWNDSIEREFSPKDIDQCITDLFAGKILPTGMETINIVWDVTGLNMIDTTHLIRHRLFSFSAQTHADRDMRNDTCLVPAGIMCNEKFLTQYMYITECARKLYAEMMDSGEVHCLDARTIMPRNFNHFYGVRSTLKDIISFCQMRGDEQIQTAVDNIVAMKLWLEILRQYPFLKGVVDFEAPDHFYVKSCKEGRTNIFPPNEKNDLFDWTDDQFIYDKHRDQFPGGDTYLRMREGLLQQMREIQ